MVSSICCGRNAGSRSIPRRSDALLSVCVFSTKDAVGWLGQASTSLKGMAVCLIGGRRVAWMSISIDYHNYYQRRIPVRRNCWNQGGLTELKGFVPTDGNNPTSSPKTIEFNSKPSQLNLIQRQFNGTSDFVSIFLTTRITVYLTKQTDELYTSQESRNQQIYHIFILQTCVCKSSYKHTCPLKGRTHANNHHFS